MLPPQKPKKYRKYFPKKGPERKTLMFLPNLFNLPKEKASAIYKKVLREKKGIERKTLIDTRRVAKNRSLVFRGIKSAFEEFSKKNPNLKGVIVFGGATKKTTDPTDLDIILVGDLQTNQKREFLKLVESRTGLFPDAPNFTLTTQNAKEIFMMYLSKQSPYFSSPREWTLQNFIGPSSIKRQIISSFNYARKKLASEKKLFSEKV